MIISRTKKISLIIVCLVAGFSASAAPSSETYRIEYDSINFVGGRGSSETYDLKATGGETATGRGSSETYVIESGFQAMDSSSLIVGFSGDPNLSPGITLPQGGRSDGVVSWVVTSSNGYTLTVKDGFSQYSDPSLLNSNYDQILPYFPQSRVLNRDEGDPPGQSYITIARNYVGNEDRKYLDYMFGANSFEDEGIPDYDWLMSSNDSRIGFSATGTDVVTAYRNNGVSCGIVGGRASAFNCWDSFRYIPDNLPCTLGSCGYISFPYASINTQRIIANANTQTMISTTTLDIRVEVGSAANQPEGVYKMTLSATVNAH
jgi:hypothetical protein